MKKIVALVLALCLVLAMAGSALAADKVTYTLLPFSNSEYEPYIYESLVGMLKVQQMADVEIEWQPVLGSRDEQPAKYLSMLSSGNYPDVIQAQHNNMYAGGVSQLYNDGIIIALEYPAAIVLSVNAQKEAAPQLDEINSYISEMTKKFITGEEPPREVCLRRLDEAEKTGYDMLRAEHVRETESRMSRCFLQLFRHLLRMQPRGSRLRGRSSGLKTAGSRTIIRISGETAPRRIRIRLADGREYTLRAGETLQIREDREK